MDQAVATAVGVLFSISTLVLLALGLAIIFGMMGVLNLAQGEFLTLGAYTVLYLHPCDPGHRALGWHSRQ